MNNLLICKQIFFFFFFFEIWLNKLKFWLVNIIIKKRKRKKENENIPDKILVENIGVRSALLYTVKGSLVQLSKVLSHLEFHMYNRTGGCSEVGGGGTHYYYYF